MQVLLDVQRICPVCTGDSRAYIGRLVKQHEMLRSAALCTTFTLLELMRQHEKQFSEVPTAILLQSGKTLTVWLISKFAWRENPSLDSAVQEIR